MRDKRIARRLSRPVKLPLAPRYYSRLCMSGLLETMGLRPMDAIVTRRCPICGQRMEISEPRGYSRAIREHMKSAHPENYVWSRRLRRMIIPLVVLIPVLAFTPAILEPELGYAPAFALSISGFIIPLALIGFMARRALRKGQGALTPARLGDLPDTSSTPFTQASQSAVSYVAQDIVGTVKDLARKLEISGLGLDSFHGKTISCAPVSVSAARTGL